MECDGPSHFLREVWLGWVGSGKVLKVENATTIAKRRFLERLGWNVVNIPFFYWPSNNTKGKKRNLVYFLKCQPKVLE
jgi:hypothetical protein